MHTPLPSFRYHPDPTATGNIVASDNVCRCCGEARGYVYTGPVYSQAELSNSICPWCIADGSAHERFEAEFTDAAGVGDYRLPNPLDRSVIDEVAFRTPGFSGWQQERWLSCCADAAEFLGRAGHRELQVKWPLAIPAIQADCALDGSEWADFLQCLDRDGSPTAYVFRCLHCGSFLGYQDCD